MSCFDFDEESFLRQQLLINTKNGEYKTDIQGQTKLRMVNVKLLILIFSVFKNKFICL
jgi:hypothetical protein